MIPFKLLSWSIILTLPVVTLGLLIGYFGSVQQGPDASSTPQLGTVLPSLLSSFNLIETASAQGQEPNGLDLSVGQTVFPNGSLLPSQPVVYSLFITNNSSVPLSGIIISDIVPLEIVSTTVVNTENGSTITELSGYPTYSWQIDNLDANTRADIYVLGRLDSSLNRSTTIANKLSVSFDGDTNPANDSSMIQSEVSVPIVSFVSRELSYTETPTKVNVSLVLDPVNPYGSAQVDYGTSSGLTASSVGALPDFETVSGTVSFAAADHRQNSISVTLFDDEIDEDNESFQLFLSNPRGASLSDSSQVTITIADDDVAGMSFSPPLLSLTEGGENTEYSLSLNSQPTAPVVVALDSLPQIWASPLAITFTAATWNMPQMVSVVAVDDKAAEGLHGGEVAHQAESLDQKYDTLAALAVTASIVDNDRASVSVSTAQLTVTEGLQGVDASTTYSIHLDTEPTQEITVSIDVEQPLSAEPPALRFSPENWDIEQMVTILTEDDSLITESAGLIRHSIISDDSAYSKASIDDVALTYIDNDLPGLNFAIDSRLKALEGVTVTYAISLNTAPERPVTIDLKVDSSQISITPKSITFDETNWNQSQLLSVTPIDDEVIEGDRDSTIEHDPQSTDLSYGEMESAEIVLRIIDNDVVLFIPYVQGK